MFSAFNPDRKSDWRSQVHAAKQRPRRYRGPFKVSGRMIRRDPHPWRLPSGPPLSKDKESKKRGFKECYQNAHGNRAGTSTQSVWTAGGAYGHPKGCKGITDFSAHFIGAFPQEESSEEDMFDVSDSSNES